MILYRKEDDDYIQVIAQPITIYTDALLSILHDIYMSCVSSDHVTDSTYSGDLVAP